MDPDVIVIPPATTADVLPPITSALTYALTQNTPTVASTVSEVSYVSQGNVYYTFQNNPSATTTQITTATNVKPLITELVTPPATSQASLEAPDPHIPDPESTPSVPSPPKKKKDDAVFLPPLPIIAYAKPKQCPEPKPSDPNQNRLIKALLAQKSTPGPYMAHPPLVRPTTSFIIRASTQTPSGQTQILNLPVSVSTPVSIARNLTPKRPAVTNNPFVKDLVHPVACSAFVRTCSGTDLVARNSAPANVSTTMVITTPMTVAPHASITPIIATTGSATIVTTTVSCAKARPYVFTSTPSLKTRTKTYPTYTKTYIPVPQIRKSKPATTNVTKPLQLVGNRALPSCPSTRKPTTITMLGPRGFSTTTGIRQRPPGPRTNVVSGYNNRYLEPGEIPYVRKIPPRTFPGPRSVSAAQRQAAAHIQEQASAKLKAARHASHHEESQATLRALQVHHSGSRAVLQATSLAALQAASHAQLEAASQERIKAAHQRAKIQGASNANTSQSLHTVASPGQLQTVTVAKPQTTLNIQLLTAAQAQLLANSKMQLQATTQAQLQATLQAQSNATSQVQLKTISPAQLQATLQAQLNANSLVQLTAISQAQLNTSSQIQLNSTLQAQPNATLQAHLNTTSQAKSNIVLQHQLNPTSQGQIRTSLQAQLNASSKAQPQNTMQAQLNPISQAQRQAALLAHLNATSQAQLQGTLQAQLNAASQAQRQVHLQAQLNATSQVQRIPSLQAQLNATSQVQRIPSLQAQLNATSQAQLTASSQAQHQNTLQAQLNATSHAQRLVHLQAQLNAASQAQRQVHLQAPLNATSQVQRLPSLQAQLNATSQAQLTASLQAQHQNSLQAQLNATSQAQRQTQLQAQLNASSQAQHQNTLQAQLNATSLAQRHISLQPQLNATSQAQLPSILTQAQLNASSKAQLQVTSQGAVLQTESFAPTQANTHAQLQVVSLAQQPARVLSQPQVQPMPNARTHHRLIIRSAPLADRVVTNPVTLQSVGDTAVAVPNAQDVSLPNTSQSSESTASSSIHTTSTLTLSTGTSLVMPHYKTTVFKNLSSIGRAEPPRLASPTTTEGVMIRRPVAYFSARRSFPTQPSTSGTPVNVQRHIIRTIPRHVLQNHLGTLQSHAAQAPSASLTPQVVTTTSSSEISVLNTLTPNKQGSDKKK